MESLTADDATRAIRSANPAATKLSHGVRLEARDRARLDALIAVPTTMPARTDIIGYGENPAHLHIIIEGFACRYKIMPDGRRSIVGLMLPGDICDLHVKILGYMDHAIGTLSECRIVRVPHDEIDVMMADYPAIARAFWWSTLVDEGILREWLTNMGRMRSDRQMTHLFCEMRLRLDVVGLARDRGFPFPLTQEELADILGIAPVHAHRVLQTLRARNLVADQGRWMTFPNDARTLEFAEFDPDYLHLRRETGFSEAAQKDGH